MSRSTSTIFSRKASPAINNGEALPWTLIGAALAAMAAAYFSSDRFVGLPALALLLVFSRFSSWRLPRHFLISYGLRAVILSVVLTLINQTDVQDSTVWYLKQGDTNLASYALAADIVLRAWQKRPAKAAREGLGVVVLMTALLFAAATNTYDRLYIQLITPIYAVMLILSFRSFALMQQSARFAYSQRPGLVFLRGIAIVLTLAFAGAGVYAVTRYEYQVTNWAMQFVRQHHSEHHDIGFAASPRLSTVFNPDPSISRVLLIDGVISEPHLRAAAFDTFQNAQWSPPASDRLFGPISTGNDLPIASAHLLKFARLGDTADFILAPLTSAQINSNDPLEQDNSGTVRDTHSGSSEPFDLLESSSPKFQGLLSVKPDAKTRGRLLAIGAEIDPRVVDLARKVAGTGERWTQVLRLQEYLRSHHAYALSFQPQGEPLSDFILNDRAAHCQYFASAMAIMARAIGVPARFVAGFYAHEPYGNGQTVVRLRVRGLQNRRGVGDRLQELGKRAGVHGLIDLVRGNGRLRPSHRRKSADCRLHACNFLIHKLLLFGPR